MHPWASVALSVAKNNPKVWNLTADKNPRTKTMSSRKSHYHVTFLSLLVRIINAFKCTGKGVSSDQNHSQQFN